MVRIVATAPRSVACTACGAPKTTRANRGVRLVCSSCGAEFRCPPPGPAESAGPGPAAPATVTPQADPVVSAVTVARGRPVVTQTARPRERGTATPKKGPDTSGPAGEAPGSDAPGAEPVGAGPAGPAPQVRTGATGDIDKLRRAGRRGGLASYARHRTRGAAR